MALQTAVRGVRSALRPAYVRALSDSGIGGGSMGSSWKDRETAAENLYFAKADAEALSKLAAKLHQVHSPSAETLSGDKATVVGILEKHGIAVSDGLVGDLMKFKYPEH